MRVLGVCSYKGTNYYGWQKQVGFVSVQSTIEEVLSKVYDSPINITGSGRTDAGVHAEGAVAVFDTSSRIPGDKFSYALNQSLPGDIIIRRSQEVAPDFHPRKTECKKTYRYTIWHDEFPMPTVCRYAHWVHYPLEPEAMKEAAGYFTGQHDFAAFCSAAADVESTVRKIYEMKIDVSGPKRCDEGGRKYHGRIDIYVTGNGFLYNMVRIIAGTLIEVGEGRIAPEDVPGIISSCDRTRAGDTAPAKGLTLVGYEY